LPGVNPGATSYRTGAGRKIDPAGVKLNKNGLLFPGIKIEKQFLFSSPDLGLLTRLSGRIEL
jgi:hypothetical protein